MAVLSLLGCSDPELDRDIEVKVQPNPFDSKSFSIDILVRPVGSGQLIDGTIIKNIIVNGGNCELSSGTVNELKEAKKIKPGHYFYASGKSCTANEVREMKITTSSGTFTFLH
jgi:hypothetical protein